MKKSEKMTIGTVIVDVILLIAGIVTDIIYWDWVYSHREPGQPGHGVPAFSFFAIFAIIIFSAVMFICIAVERNKEYKNKM